MIKIIVALLLTCSAIPFAAFAAEVKNIKVGQEGDKAIATYDLGGSGGEHEAEVIVAITINGERRTSDKLSLTGDYGRNVKVGPGKRIVWNAMADLPPDLEVDLRWDINVAKAIPVKNKDSGLFPKEGAVDRTCKETGKLSIVIESALDSQCTGTCNGRCDYDSEQHRLPSEYKGCIRYRLIARNLTGKEKTNVLITNKVPDKLVYNTGAPCPGVGEEGLKTTDGKLVEVPDNCQSGPIKIKVDSLQPCGEFIVTYGGQLTEE